MKIYIFSAILILLISYVLFRETDIYNIVKLDSIGTGAMCLDGSDYQFYLQKGFGDGVDKLVFFFDGGGWCSSKTYNSTLESCYQRSFTYLGSSDYGILQKIRNFFGKTLLVKRIMPFLSSDSNSNPTFYNWNKVFLSYCDGRGYVGFNDEPIHHNNKKLYFRGYNNTLGALNYVKNNFPKLTNVIISGISAGGLASFYYSNFISEYFHKDNLKVDIKSITDSGFMLDVPNEKNTKYNFGIVWKDLLDHTKPTLPPVLDCEEKEKWKCFLPEYFYHKINIPVFILHSQYDTYAVCHLFGSCERSLTKYTFNNIDDKTKLAAEKNRLKILDIFRKILLTKKDWVIFSPSCFIHDFLAYSLHFDKTLMIKGKTIKESLASWMKRDESENNVLDYIDDAPWPSNKSCWNYNDFLHYLQYFNILVDIF